MKMLLDEAGNIWHTQAKREERLRTGVKGAHMIMPFQCELCWMRLLEGRDIQAEDTTYVQCLRRANLDAIAGKARSTIISHRGRVRANVLRCKELGKTPSFEPRGPFPNSDCVGMGTAVDILYKSITAKGKIADHVQFDTLRQERSTAAKVYESSPKGMAEGYSFAKGTGKVRPTSCNLQSEWFSDFLRGCEYRMGSDSHANKAVSIKAMVEVLKRIKRDADQAEDEETKNQLYKVGAYLAVVTVCSLRGHEGFYADLHGLLKYIEKGKVGVMPEDLEQHFSEDDAANLPHVVVCLRGKFKSENNEDYHIICLANTTRSGIQLRWWIEKLLSIASSEGRDAGPAFASKAGDLASSTDYDAVFRDYLKQVQNETNLIQDDHDIDIHYGISRTPRKSAETRAKQAKLDDSLQDAMNRWRTFENAKGGRPKFKQTRDLYADAVAYMALTWSYSYAL
jgi:hypothetical protein